MVNERKDFIELGTLTMDELAGVVHLYPWFASARKELCRRMSRLGGDDWGEEQYAEEALYIGDRRKVAELVRSGRKADYADKDVEKILRSYIAPAAEPDGEEEHKVHVVGGDYFSQAQYKDVGRADDNIFTRFAVKVKSDGVKDERTGSDIADRYATETLAEIFAEQGCVEEARRIYSRLILENPEKIVLAAILLIVVVLLQNGKDGGLATNFTSANQALGVRQTATILEKATWYLIAFILVLAIASTLVISHGSQASTGDAVSSEILNEAAPASETPAFPVDIPQTDPTAE